MDGRHVPLSTARDMLEAGAALAAEVLRLRRELVDAAAAAERLEAELGALSPLKVLDRGYSIAFDESGRAVRSSRQLPAGARFALRLQDGTVSAESRGAKG